jgi:hypothetical protein
MPLIILYIGILYGTILTIGALYGFSKTKSVGMLVRDAVIIILVLASCHYGITTSHWSTGLVGLGCGALLSIWIHSREFSKTSDMAPFGHMTALSIISTVFVIAGLLTSQSF